MSSAVSTFCRFVLVVALPLVALVLHPLAAAGMAREGPLDPDTARRLLEQADERRFSAGLVFLLRRAAGLLPAPPPSRVAVAPVRIATPANGGVAAPDPSGPDFATQSETTVVAVGSKVVLAYNDSRSYFETLDFTGYSVSLDGGVTWTDKNAPPNPSGCRNGGDPVLARDSAGNVYLAMLASCGSDEHIGVARMPAGQSTFQPWVIASVGASAGSLADKPWLAVGPNPSLSGDSLYVTWTEFPFSGSPTLRAARSTDGGASWEPLPGFAVTCSCQFTFPVVSPTTGAVLVFYEEFGTSRALKVRSSTDGGDTWSPPRLVSSVTKAATHTACGRDVIRVSNSERSVRLSENPSAAILGDTAVVTWNDGRFNRSDILIATSTDGGATWSAPQRINQTRSGHQFMPAVTADARGFHFQWYSTNRTRRQINVVGRDMVGGSLGPEFVISSTKFRATRTNIGGKNQDVAVACTYMGDYNQPYADGSVTHYAWGDNRLEFSGGFPDPNPFYARR